MLLAVLAAFAGAFVQSATGMGFALVLSPALFAVMDPEEAVTAVLILGAALCLLVLAESRHVQPHGLRRLMLAAIPGLPLGVVLLVALSKATLQVGVGVVVIVAALWQLRHGAGALRLNALVAGFFSGLLTTSISVNGPPLALWLDSERVHAPGFPHDARRLVPDPGHRGHRADHVQGGCRRGRSRAHRPASGLRSRGLRARRGGLPAPGRRAFLDRRVHGGHLHGSGERGCRNPLERLRKSSSST